ncbi:40S ribosomal protein S17-1 [Acorus calamus]|uniref:40S ribosomal protein S17-1 n=1 Tax=Acorus calamus TaxID=4465 RepID=A0AAV9CZD7_ACOCL|nr:40S ribosomal protein S17-1 [Acorus calamus]
MGRVRTKTVKKSSRQVIERYYSRMTLDFHTNKKVIEEVAIIPSKRLRNKIAGFSTHLMKRIQRGPVRGISLKLQEERGRGAWTSSPTSPRSKLTTSRSTRRPSICSPCSAWPISPASSSRRPSRLLSPSPPVLAEAVASAGLLPR